MCTTYTRLVHCPFVEDVSQKRKSLLARSNSSFFFFFEKISDHCQTLNLYLFQCDPIFPLPHPPIASLVSCPNQLPMNPIQIVVVMRKHRVPSHNFPVCLDQKCEVDRAHKEKNPHRNVIFLIPILLISKKKKNLKALSLPIPTIAVSSPDSPCLRSGPKRH